MNLCMLTHLHTSSAVVAWAVMRRDRSYVASLGSPQGWSHNVTGAKAEECPSSSRQSPVTRCVSEVRRRYVRASSADCARTCSAVICASCHDVMMSQDSAVIGRVQFLHWLFNYWLAALWLRMQTMSVYNMNELSFLRESHLNKSRTGGNGDTLGL